MKNLTPLAIAALITILFALVGCEPCSPEGCQDDCEGVGSLAVMTNLPEGHWDVYTCGGDRLDAGPNIIGEGAEETVHTLIACQEAPGFCYNIVFGGVEDYYTPEIEEILLLAGQQERIQGEYVPME
ncbi:hypothetical protein KKF04_02190 [Patescibacteria group bacterium]|nr:hypothetical protein [Patescibacteria group bacterium]MBU1934843.1 hypothetical protein [Patescibacteria group bacterium]